MAYIPRSSLSESPVIPKQTLSVDNDATPTGCKYKMNLATSFIFLWLWCDLVSFQLLGANEKKMPRLPSISSFLLQTGQYPERQSSLSELADMIQINRASKPDCTEPHSLVMQSKRQIHDKCAHSGRAAQTPHAVKVHSSAVDGRMMFESRTATRGCILSALFCVSCTRLLQVVRLVIHVVMYCRSLK